MSGAKDSDDEDLLEMLRAADRWARSHARKYRRLTRTLLERYREARLREHWEQGIVCWIPGGATVVTRFGSLPEAMLRAGLLGARARDLLERRRGVELQAALIAWYVREAAAELGRGMTKRAFRKWGEEREAETDEFVPSPGTVVRRLGAAGWPDAIDRSHEEWRWSE